MRLIFTLLGFCFVFQSWSQSIDNLVIRGDYTTKDSLELVRAYINAGQAVYQMYDSMKSIFNDKNGNAIKDVNLIKSNWLKSESFVTWMGKPEKLNLAKKRISKIYKLYQKRVILEVTKEDKGRCRGWISAWAIPYGKTRVVLCDKYFRYRTHLHEKIIIHELGHEIGMLSHKRIHGCWAAQRAAATPTSNVSKKNPENYAWLAMSFMGLPCGY